MLTTATRCGIFMTEGTLTDETNVYAMGVLVMQAITDPSVEVALRNLQRLV